MQWIKNLFKWLFSSNEPVPTRVMQQPNKSQPLYQLGPHSLMTTRQIAVDMLEAFRRHGSNRIGTRKLRKLMAEISPIYAERKKFGTALTGVKSKWMSDLGEPGYDLSDLQEYCRRHGIPIPDGQNGNTWTNVKIEQTPPYSHTVAYQHTTKHVEVPFSTPIPVKQKREKREITHISIRQRDILLKMKGIMHNLQTDSMAREEMARRLGYVGKYKWMSFLGTMSQGSQFIMTLEKSRGISYFTLVDIDRLLALPSFGDPPNTPKPEKELKRKPAPSSWKGTVNVINSIKVGEMELLKFSGGAENPGVLRNKFYQYVYYHIYKLRKNEGHIYESSRSDEGMIIHRVR